MLRKVYKGYLYAIVLPVSFFISFLFDPSGNLVRMTNDVIKEV
ncbi:MAG TPA: hypothetical protein VNR61_17170 [Niallia sp.]|nr:hypothetical protein [Niallia sp.]